MSAGVPAPGLDGTYRESCAACLRGTDTGLALRGEAEWVIAGLSMFHIGQDEAAAMVSDVTGCDPGMVPSGEVTVFVTLCRECAAASTAGPADVALLSGGQVPCYVQPGHE